jgi:hypothetical protein
MPTPQPLRPEILRQVPTPPATSAPRLVVASSTPVEKDDSGRNHVAFDQDVEIPDLFEWRGR